MKIDVVGKVKNTVVPLSIPLLPVYEAIVNSFQAIKASGRDDGFINVILYRDDEQLEIDGFSLGPINKFKIIDNGLGFNDDNYNSFETSESTYKINSGGRGIGRFSWLVCFDHAVVDSVFSSEDGLKRRNFVFLVTEEGIEDHSLSDSNSSEITTSVELVNYKDKYKDKCPKGLSIIASYIIEECLELFINYGDIIVNLIEDKSGENICLNNIIDSDITSKSVKETINIGDYKFYLMHVEIKSKHKSDHSINYCGGIRIAKKIKLLGKVSNLTKTIFEDESNEKISYFAYVNSDYLDARLDPGRKDFDIQDDGIPFEGELTWEIINNSIVPLCSEYLKKYTESEREKKINKITNLINKDAPRYRVLLKYCENEINSIDPDIADTEILGELSKIKNTFQNKLKTEGRELLNADKNVKKSKEYETKLKQYLKQITNLNESDLAEYVLHRKIILNIIEDRLSWGKDEQYYEERDIHDIIFPMGKTSEEIDYDDFQLWLLDERLAYHYYLSSDMPLKKVEAIDSDGDKEPDVIIFDNPHAFSTEGTNAYSAVYIFELKRPMLNDYPDKRDPVKQVLNYIEKIRDSKEVNRSGRIIEVHENTPFYGYILCDLTSKLRKIAKERGFTKTPDGLGYFWYAKNYNAYIEIISYDKMHQDALRKNSAFFDKLGLGNI